jgi:hypothetical protein
MSHNGEKGGFLAMKIKHVIDHEANHGMTKGDYNPGVIPDMLFNKLGKIGRLLEPYLWEIGIVFPDLQILRCPECVHVRDVLFVERFYMKNCLVNVFEFQHVSLSLQSLTNMFFMYYVCSCNSNKIVKFLGMALSQLCKPKSFDFCQKID